MGSSHTGQDAHDSKVKLWFGETATRGAHTTLNACQSLKRPTMFMTRGEAMRRSHVTAQIAECSTHVLNVVGNHEPKARGIGDHVEGFLIEQFRQLGHPKRHTAGTQADRRRRSPWLTLLLAIPRW
jgi:hypothetical protein